MRFAIGLTAAALCACASLEPQEVSPAIYLQDGVVILPHVASLEACANSIRLGAKASDPKSLGEFVADPNPSRGSLGGCLTFDDRYYLITETDVTLSQNSHR